MWRNSSRLWPLILVLALGCAAWLSWVFDYLNLEFLQSHRALLLAKVEANPILSVAVFVTMYVLVVALSLPVATPMTLLGGFLFGRWVGTLAAVTGATGGAAIIFLIARSSLGKALRKRAGPLYARVAVNIDHNATGYMLFLRLVPVFPFFLVNILPALFNVRLLPYVLTTFFGMLPGTFVYANVGRELGSIKSMGDIVSGPVLLAISLLGIFALIPILYRAFKPRRASASIAMTAESTSNIDNYRP